MNVLFPFKRPKNEFLDEIEPYFKGNFVFKEFDDSSLDMNKIDVINIHWPEAIFDWKSPTNSQLDSFKLKFNMLSKKKKIIYTRHNIYPHTLRTNNYLMLYDFICENVDGVIHFGEFSISEFKNRYPKIETFHIIIEHPLYKKLLKVKPANKPIILPKNKINITVFGATRNREEISIAVKSFLKLNRGKYNLIITNNAINTPRCFIILKLTFLYKYLSKFYFRLFGIFFLEQPYLNSSELKQLMNLTDIIFIHRINNLNSGLLYLGLTFKKPIVVPEIGNLTEKIDDYGLFGFDTNKIITARNSIEAAALNLNNRRSYCRKLNPKVIAKDYFSFFNKLIEL